MPNNTKKNRRRIPEGCKYEDLTPAQQSYVRQRQLAQTDRRLRESVMTTPERTLSRHQKRKAKKIRERASMPSTTPPLTDAQKAYIKVRDEIAATTPSLDEALVRLRQLPLGTEEMQEEETRMRREDRAHRKWVSGIIENPQKQDPAYVIAWRAAVRHRLDIGILRGTERGQLTVVQSVHDVLEHPPELEAKTQPPGVGHGSDGNASSPVNRHERRHGCRLGRRPGRRHADQETVPDTDEKDRPTASPLLSPPNRLKPKNHGPRSTRAQNAQASR
ncbi:hypothetical protein OPT61_g6564 [Boeremia exigua]|uniref:Uncharacterized protein n=1 Tax=Boeremia exigua TaxID=749465 RepID=A0ACC2I5N7_9PLEO|nr:hypothetical protein OPT61_g6564 [Boeremia exigua]